MNVFFKLSMRHITFFVIILIITKQGIIAQDIHKDNLKIKPFAIAEELFIQGKYYEAINYYERSLLDPKYKHDSHLNYNLAECYRLSRQYAKSEMFYKAVYGRSPLRYPLSLFWLGKMQKANEKYNDAFANFKTYSKNKKSDKIFIDEAKREMTLCDSSIKAKLNMTSVIVEILGPEVNTELTTDRATLRNDTLWYISTIRDGANDNVVLEDTKGQYKDIFTMRLFYSAAGKNGKRRSGNLIEIPIDDKKNDIVSPFFEPVSNKLFFTICGNNGCAIYQTHFEKGGFTKPVILDASINVKNTSSKDPMPVIIKNKEYLFFVSDREKNAGFDVFYCTIDKNGKPGMVQNLGNNINTKYDEQSPFFDPALQTLYFSSRGHNTVGGYDIFSVKGNLETGWGNVSNMGFPINSGADDYYYFHQSTGNNYHTFISSNRPTKDDELFGTVCDNVFQYKFNIGKAMAPPTFITLKCSMYDDAKCSIFDDEWKIPLPENTIKLFMKSTDKLVDEKYSLKTNTISLKLKRDSAYTIEVSKKDYYSAILKVNATTTDTIILKKVCLIKIGSPDVVIAEEPKIEIVQKPKKIDRTQLIQPIDFKFPVVYFDFNKSDVIKSDKKNLNALADELIKRPELIIYVEAFTDNIDTKNFNIYLSQKRTESVVNYLIERGVEKERLIGQWYGEEKPVAANEDPQSRALNRRAEFAIINDQTTVRRGQMVSGDVVDEAFENKKEYGTDIEEESFKQLLQKYGRKNKTELCYRVQIGAYKNTDAGTLAKMNQFANKQSKTNVVISVESDGELKKYVTSRYTTLDEANDCKNLIETSSIKNAFIVPYYRGNRIKMSELVFLFTN